MIEFHAETGTLYITRGDTCHHFSITEAGHWYYERSRSVSTGEDVATVEGISLPLLLARVVPAQ